MCHHKQLIAGKDLDELMYVFITGLNAGDSFVIGRLSITIHSIAKDKTMRWLVNGNRKKVHYTNGVYYGFNGHGRKTDWFVQCLRDIEGILICDLLNVHNPFHELSGIGKLIAAKLLPDAAAQTYHLLSE